MTSCCDTMREAPAETARATPSTRSTGHPALDVIETPEAFRLLLEVPGSGKEDVDLGVEEGILSIRARVPSREDRPERYHLRERDPRELVRRLRLGDTIDAAGITAEVVRGLLTIHLPKVAAATPRQIEVR